MGRLFSEFLSPLVLRTAGGVFWPVNFSSLSPSLKKLPPTALRAFGPVPTLRNAVCFSPYRPLLLVAGAGVWGTFLLGVAFRHCRRILYQLSHQGGRVLSEPSGRSLP